jgi:hypothetical protein
MKIGIDVMNEFIASKRSEEFNGIDNTLLDNFKPQRSPKNAQSESYKISEEELFPFFE